MLPTDRSKSKEPFIHTICLVLYKYLREFVNKRQDNFLAIANRHEYYLQSQFQRLMEKYGFDDCDIKIDHKREELEILV